MDKSTVLKAIADDTRMKIVTLLLKHNYCVRALAKELSLSESTISQHLKVLREAGLLIGEKRGYFMHYDVERTALRELAGEIEALAAVKREACTQEAGRCGSSEHEKCHGKNCGDETKEFCHGPTESEGSAHRENCQCHRT